MSNVLQYQLMMLKTLMMKPMGFVGKF